MPFPEMSIFEPGSTRIFYARTVVRIGVKVRINLTL